MGFPGKSTGVGCQALLQGIFPSQGSNPHLLLGRQTPYQRATWEALYQDAPHKRERAADQERNVAETLFPSQPASCILGQLG